ncbi:MAG: hypothetical protein V4673_09110 [Pseudomonadota bacterium]
MKLSLVCVVCIAIGMALTGCDRSHNYKEAAYFELDGRYTVTLSGKRMLMAHDPVSLILSKTYEEHLELDLPRLSGTIRGDDIPVKSGYEYTGTIEVSGTQMRVNLYYDNTDDEVSKPLSWNGQYVLVNDKAVKRI